MDEGSQLEEIYATCDECTQLGVQLGSSELLAQAARPPPLPRCQCNSLPACMASGPVPGQASARP